MSVRKKDDPTLYAKIEGQNLVRQYDLLSNCIEIGLNKGIEAFDKYTLWALNYAAVSNICQLGVEHVFSEWCVSGKRERPFVFMLTLRY